MAPETNGTQTMTLQQFPRKAARCYGEVELSRLDCKLAMFNALPSEDRVLLPEFEPRITALAECIQENVRLLKIMAESAETIHIARTRPPTTTDTSGEIATTAVTNAETANGVRGCIELKKGNEGDDGARDGEGEKDEEDEDERQFLSREVRRGFTLLAKDWSVEGAAQRAALFEPLIEAVEEAYAEAARVMTSLSREKFRVLVSCAGAGRLAWELVRKGFAVEGCEESFSALLVGNFALNWTAGEGGNVFYPFVHEHSNVRKGEIVMRGVEIPDVDPKEISNKVEFAMRAGAFVEAYAGQDGNWDAVCSCLGFDLGEGVVEFVRRVSTVVKAGGIWTFVGPIPCLDGGGGDTIHLSIEEVMGIVRKSGFKIIKREEVSVLHSDDPKSMRSIYLKVPFVVAIKIRPAV